MKINKKIYTISALAILVTLMSGTSAFAETTAPNSPQVDNQGNHFGQIRNNDNKGMMRPTVVGQVTAISDNTITINGRQGYGRKDNTTTTPVITTTTFTIDATNAKIEKGGNTVTITNITVGDTIMVQGTVTGTNVIATNIRDGVTRGQGQNKVNGNKNGDQKKSY
jgi:hypothetical protein